MVKLAVVVKEVQKVEAWVSMHTPDFVNNFMEVKVKGQNGHILDESANTKDAAKKTRRKKQLATCASNTRAAHDGR